MTKSFVFLGNLVFELIGNTLLMGKYTFKYVLHFTYLNYVFNTTDKKSLRDK